MGHASSREPYHLEQHMRPWTEALLSSCEKTLWKGRSWMRSWTGLPWQLVARPTLDGRFTQVPVPCRHSPSPLAGSGACTGVWELVSPCPVLHSGCWPNDLGFDLTLIRQRHQHGALHGTCHSETKAFVSFRAIYLPFQTVALSWESCLWNCFFVSSSILS